MRLVKNCPCGACFFRALPALLCCATPAAARALPASVLRGTMCDTRGEGSGINRRSSCVVDANQPANFEGR
jgi:hypothetical protein